MSVMTVLLSMVCALGTSANAAPSVSVSGECGDWVTIDITLDAAGDYRMIWGDPGSDTVPLGSCAGTSVDIDGSVAPLRTASDGEDSIVLLSNVERCSQSIQVIEISSCEVSPAVSLSTLQGAGYEAGFIDGAASVEREMNCFQSAYCWYGNERLMTGTPRSKHGPATQAECQAVDYSWDWYAWKEGEAVQCPEIWGCANQIYLCESDFE
jgi:hypothetical protein